jgi:hypothetical protein
MSGCTCNDRNEDLVTPDPEHLQTEETYLLFVGDKTIPACVVGEYTFFSFLSSPSPFLPPSPFFLFLFLFFSFFFSSPLFFFSFLSLSAAPCYLRPEKSLNLSALARRSIIGAAPVMWVNSSAWCLQIPHLKSGKTYLAPVWWINSPPWPAKAPPEKW